MRPRAKSERGLTLVEVLIVVALIAITTAAVSLGAGVAGSARLRRSAIMIASAIRIAQGHANASSHPTRIVFNFDQRMVSIEEAVGELALAKNERTGGAAAATEAERKAMDEADQVLKGPRAPRPSFKPVKEFGFAPGKDAKGKELERGIRFLQIETGHQDEAVKTDQAYLYFWPGGLTERAAIQLSLGGSDLDGDVTTILVSPLTGKADVRKGKFLMIRPRSDDEDSERRDSVF